MCTKLSMPLLLLVALGCAGQSPQAPQSQPRSPFAAPAGDGPQPVPLALNETLAGADRAYDSQLGMSRGNFDVERQIGALKEAVLLYQQFLERAEGRPELEAAVRKSHERIEDANATIVFLSASLSGPRRP